MAFDHSKFLARFVEEAREHCSRISEGLLNIESSPDDAELLNALFRSAHTIKGSSRMMKLSGVTELAHHMEDILDAVRGNRIPLAPSVSGVLFRGVDALLVILEAISGGDKAPEAPQSLIEELVQAATTPAATVAMPVSSPITTPPSSHESNPVSSGEIPIHPSAAQVALPDKIPARIEMEAAKPKPVVEDHASSYATPKAKQAEYLRINAAKLDDLIRLMGEIVSEHGRFRRHIGRLREIERAAARHLEGDHRGMGQP